MKFYSKFSNYRIVLVSSLPAEPVTGRHPVPGIFAKFENGECTVNDQKVIDMLLDHKDFGRDFVSEESGDKFSAGRRDMEPQHDNVDLEFGHVGRNKNPKKTSLTDEQQRFLKDAAKELAIPLAKEMAAQMLKELAAEQKAIMDEKADSDTTEEKIKTETTAASSKKK